MASGEATLKALLLLLDEAIRLLLFDEARGHWQGLRTITYTANHVRAPGCLLAP